MTTSEIRAKVKQSGCTQEQYAHIIGVSFTTVNRWVNGHSVPTRKSILDRIKGIAEKGNIMQKINILSVKEVELKANCRKIHYELLDENGERDSVAGGQVEYIDLPDGYCDSEIDTIIEEHFKNQGLDVS